MSVEGSVTRWIADLRLGDSAAHIGQAQQACWDRYFHRLLGLARIKLGDSPRTEADEEDVVVAALQSFFSGVPRNKFPRLHDRDSLWPLLAKITSHKAIDQRRRQLAQKKGGGNVRGDSAILGTAETTPDWPDALLDEEIRPDFLVAMSEQCQHLMSLLGDDQMREIARRRLEGYTNAEIAEQLGVVERTVERRLSLIRDYWANEVDTTTHDEPGGESDN